MPPPDVEYLGRDALSALQADRVAAVLRVGAGRSPFYRAKYRAAGVDPAALGAGVALADLPFTTKAELLADQAAAPPFGTNLTLNVERYARVHQSSGTTTGRPLRWLDTPENWNWALGCWDAHFRFVGLKRDDRLFFPFSFGPFLGFWTAFEAAHRAGHFAVPAGGMSSSARLKLLLELRATVVFCTPTYALHLADVAEAEGLDLAGSAVRAVVVAGEPGAGIPATRARIERGWGARLFDHHGLTEVGPCATECPEAPGGLHVLEHEFVAEVIDPDTLAPAEPGAAGELVLTNLGRLHSPLVRYRTGDMVRVRPGGCACGRTFARLDGGVLGRYDDMIHVRGNNVYPGAIEDVVRRFAAVAEYRVEVDHRAAMAELRVAVEPAPGADGPRLAADVARALRDELLFRADVTAVPAGTLPRFEMKARRVVHVRAQPDTRDTR